MRALLLFSQAHAGFRGAELRALWRMAGGRREALPELDERKTTLKLEVDNEERLKSLVERAFLVKAAFEYLAEAKSLDELEETVRKDADIRRRILERHPDEVGQTTWRTAAEASGRKRGIDTVGIAKRFADLTPFERAPIDLRAPQLRLVVLMCYADKDDAEPETVYFLRQIATSSGSALVSRYDIPLRPYIGNTTMDPMLAFIQANLALCQSPALVCDPFCGTGGLLLAAAEMGAHCVGTELDYQTARAEGRSSRHNEKMIAEDASLEANFAFYGTRDRWLGVMIADASRHDLWRREIFDAIVADPPYGVREKCRQVGKLEEKDDDGGDGGTEEPRALSAQYVRHYPQKRPYTLGTVFTDLLDFAAGRLRLGGRLAFWLPIVQKSYSPDQLPRHPRLELIENCEQPLTMRTSRRLLVYEKTAADREEGEEAGGKATMHPSAIHHQGANAFRRHVIPTL